MLMKKAMIAIALVAGVVLSSDAEPSGGVACASLPGASISFADSTAAQVVSIASSYRLITQLGSGGPGTKICATSASGAVVGIAVISRPGSIGDFCSFGTARGGSCIIRLVDGLPVELMSFSVDDEEAVD